LNYKILSDAQREYQDIEERYLGQSVERALTFRRRFDAEVENWCFMIQNARGFKNTEPAFVA